MATASTLWNDRNTRSFITILLCGLKMRLFCELFENFTFVILLRRDLKKLVTTCGVFYKINTKSKIRFANAG